MTGHWIRAQKKKQRKKDWTSLPVFAGGTLEENDAGLVRTFCEGMCGAMTAVVCGTGKCQLELRFGVCGDARRGWGKSGMKTEVSGEINRSRENVEGEARARARRRRRSGARRQEE